MNAQREPANSRQEDPRAGIQTQGRFAARRQQRHQPHHLDLRHDLQIKNHTFFFFSLTQKVSGH